VEEYLDVVRSAGFVDLELGELVDVFSGSAHESDAREFETRGVSFRARKPGGKRLNG
jgi:hypothetical protein